MKLISTFFRPSRYNTFTVLFFLQFFSFQSESQICSNPNNVIYGLTGNGAIYPITVATATVGAAVKSTSYSGNSASSSNGLAYNSANGKFYYFKRNVGGSNQEFVSYDPAQNIVQILKISTCAADIHTGAITADGRGYYTIDVNGNFNYYDIINNNWVFISANFKDQFGVNVTSVIQSQNAGDIAFDGNGNLWIVTSSSSNYGLYELPAPMPTSATASPLVLTKKIDPSAATPSGNSIAGIAFNPTGQIFIATKNDNRLYRIENNLTNTYLGTFSVNDVGNDLTSCAFPLGVLPVKWISYTATLINNSRVDLVWNVVEQDNPVYSVEYSTDGINWKEITYIKSNNKGGETQQYTYTHYSPTKGKNYYRIKMTDALNNKNFSDTKLIDLNSQGTSLSLWPNPASDFIRVNSPFENGNSAAKIRVYDLTGKMQIEGQLKPGESIFNISALKSGTYIINLYSIDGNSCNQKFIKM
ncbi:MAG: T9SS type A sorting domain-containing protein [Chitinophagaceae bacterium]|nr:T9SS type A sorting domain-containing protein [Chitinophagaceae bacterium]